MRIQSNQSINLAVCNTTQVLFLSYQKQSKMMNDSRGFVSSLPTFSQSTDASPTPAKRRDAQPLFPVTVKQISESTSSNDANFLIDGLDVFNVKLVGMVFNKTARLTDISFLIDDGTGCIGCKKWLNGSQDTKEVNELTDGMHVRVRGHLKIYQGKKEIVAHSIRPVTDYNGIAKHFLECIYSHSLHSKSQTSGNKHSVSARSSNFPAVATPNGTQVFSFTEYSEDGLGNLEKRILDFLQQPWHCSASESETGVHQNEIAQKLKVPKEKIEESLESLVQVGLVYSTIDEYHFKITDPNGTQAVSFSQYSEDGLGNLEKRILDFLQQPWHCSASESETGVHQNEIAQKLKVPKEKIEESLESLVQVGLVYSTIDEYHFKITDPNGTQAVSFSQFSEEGLGNLEKKIIDFLRQPWASKLKIGVHQNEIAQKMKVPKEMIEESLGFLEQEGFVYTTFDEFHFKTL